jgi:hypothetical protein
VLSCVRQMCWHRYRVRKGLVMLLSVMLVVLKLCSFFSLIYNKSPFIEGQRWTCLNMSILCHMEALQTFKRAVVAI